MGGRASLTEILLSGGALRHNVRVLRSLFGEGAPVAAVVKGNAYGHGLAEIAGVLESEVEAFQVDDLDELRALRGVSNKRTLVLGYVPKSDVAEAALLGGELAVYDFARLDHLAASNARVHVKVDALLGRQGILPNEVGRLAAELRRRPSIEVLSAYTHFANIEDTTDLVHAQAQLEVFERCFAELRQAFSHLRRHVSATSGVMALGSGDDLVRLGIGIYGMYPSASLERRNAALGLRPVMTWRTRLAQVKELPARHPVGYGLTYLTSRPTRIGIVPQGYADGYDRGLSNVGEVLVGGRRCPVLGRVAMNMFAVDLSGVPDSHPEDEVVLLGEQGSERITAEEIASRLGTINYEVTARISPLLARRIVA